MKTLELHQWLILAFIVNGEHTSHFFLMDEFEQANVCSVHIENTNTSEAKIRYLMCYVVVF